jgi:hypothetical protein
VPEPNQHGKQTVFGISFLIIMNFHAEVAMNMARA